MMDAETFGQYSDCKLFSMKKKTEGRSAIWGINIFHMLSFLDFA
jgi:hypothetical protein